jgi:hypothetical protein
MIPRLFRIELIRSCRNPWPCSRNQTNASFAKSRDHRNLSVPDFGTPLDRRNTIPRCYIEVLYIYENEEASTSSTITGTEYTTELVLKHTINVAFHNKLF